MRLLVANLRKLVRRPASYVTLLLVAALLALVYASLIITARVSTDATAALAARSLITFPNAWVSVLNVILGVASFLALAYAGAVAGSEWSWGTLKGAVARGESRGGYQVSMLAGVVLAIIVGLVVLYVVGVIVSIVGAVVLGQSLDAVADPDGFGPLPEALARSGLALALYASFGYAVATVARSQIAGIAVAIGVYFVEGIGRFFASEILQWSPFGAAEALTSAGGEVSVGSGPGSVTLHQLSDPTAAIVTGAWIVVALVVTIAFTERAEIGG
jgi:hypothetical protein